MQDQQLLQQIKNAVEEERQATTQVLHLLMEIEKRKLFAQRGYDSLFSFTVQYLGYSEPAAHRRISAMRALKEFPSLEPKINSGELTLTNIAQVQVALRQEIKIRPVASEVKLQLYEASLNKSTRECEKLIRQQMPATLTQERRREIDEKHTELKITLDEETIQKLEQLKQLWSHKLPSGSDSELIKAMAEFCLTKEDSKRKVSLAKKESQSLAAETKKPPTPQNLTTDTKKSPRPSKTPAPESRYIPNKLRRHIWQRDQGICQFKDHLTQKICGSKRFIQIDHVQPWALGGTHIEGNLQLLCRAHNSLRAERTFGSSD